MSQRPITVAEFRAMTGGKSAATRSTRAPRGGRGQRTSRGRTKSEVCIADSFTARTEPVVVRLPLAPPLNHYYRTAVICGHAQTYISARGREYREQVAIAWREQVGSQTFHGRVAVRVEVVQRDKREADIDGYLKALLDSLQHAGAFADDKQVKLLVVNQELTEAPGWLVVTVGLKPGANGQKNLFDCGW